MKRCIFVFALAVFSLSPSWVRAQNIPAATRGDLEVGATYTNSSLGIDGTLTGTDIPAPHDRIWGGSVYLNLNATSHLGLTAQFHYPDYHTPDDILEKSYLVGIRYAYPIDRYVPYVKVLAGLGSVSYDKPANWITAPGIPGSYGVFAYGGGLDVRFSHHITVRAIDFEAQDWPGMPPNGISPAMISVGVAYRIR